MRDEPSRKALSRRGVVDQSGGPVLGVSVPPATETARRADRAAARGYPGEGARELVRRFLGGWGAGCFGSLELLAGPPLGGGLRFDGHTLGVALGEGRGRGRAGDGGLLLTVLLLLVNHLRKEGECIRRWAGLQKLLPDREGQTGCKQRDLGVLKCLEIKGVKHFEVKISYIDTGWPTEREQLTR